MCSGLPPTTCVYNTNIANCKRRLVHRTVQTSAKRMRAVTRCHNTHRFLPSIAAVLSVNKRSVGYYHVGSNTISRVLLGRTYSSNYKSFLSAFTRSLKVSVERFSGLTLATNRPTSLNSHYAMFVGSHMQRTRGGNISVTSVSTKLSCSIVGGTLCGIVHLHSTSRLNGGVMIRNNAFCGSTILHTLRGLLNYAIIHPSITKLVNTCKVTLVAQSHYPANRTAALVTPSNLTSLSFSGRTGHYPNYNGRYVIAVVHFRSNQSFIANGHYRENTSVVLAKGATPRSSLPGVCH